jgi:hypothetical protein
MYVASLKEQEVLLSTLELPAQRPVPLKKIKRPLVVEGKGQAVKKSDESKRVSEIRSKVTEKQRMKKKLNLLRKMSMQQARELREKLRVKQKNSGKKNLSELSQCLLIHEMQSSMRGRTVRIPRSEINHQPFRHVHNAEFDKVLNRRRSHASDENRGNALSCKNKENSKSNDCSRQESELISDSNCEKEEIEDIQREAAVYGEEFKEDLVKLKKNALEIESVKQVMQKLNVPDECQKNFTMNLDHPSTLPLISDADENSDKEGTPEKEESEEIEPVPELTLDDSRHDLTEHIKILQK